MTIDIICLIVIFLGAYMGYSKGILKSLFSIMAFIIALMATFKLSPIIINLLKSNVDIDPRLNILLGFLLTFMIFYAGIRFIGSMIEKILKTVHLNFINKMSGAVLYVLIALIVFSYSLYFANQLNLISTNQRSSSIIYTHLEKIPNVSQEFAKSIKPVLNSFWEETNDAMDEINTKSQNGSK